MVLAVEHANGLIFLVQAGDPEDRSSAERRPVQAGAGIGTGIARRWMQEIAIQMLTAARWLKPALHRPQHSLSGAESRLPLQSALSLRSALSRGGIQARYLSQCRAAG